ncbi:MAG TPA: type II secretion system F family protein [Candidatus Limnocylindrales bacterium]|nr:type II secretion system F family protein [Candidatus Limnocylindrales bacterium]
MAAYAYKASTREGRIVEGLMEASGEAAVVASLRGQGFIPLAVREGTTAAAASSRGFSLPDLASMSLPWRRAKKVKGRDLMIFTGELATLLKAGLPLDRSLASLSALSENPTLKAVVSQVLARVQEGRSLSQALGEHPAVFPPLYVNMIRAGEAGGIVEGVLERLADYLERSEKTREQIKSAMVYPIILIVTAGGAIAILLTVVMPRFAAIFADLGTAMPASTQAVMAISEFVKSYWWLLVLSCMGVWYGIRRYVDTPAGRERYDRLALSAPVFGDLVSKLQVARFARTLGTMLRGGVPLIQSLDIVRSIVPNVIISRALAAVQRDVSEGKGLSGPLERTGVFPPLALQMVGVGEETGRLDEMLIVVSDHYDREVTNAVARVMTLIGPVILIFMAVVIGVIVWAMMSAVFSVNQMIL